MNLKKVALGLLLSGSIFAVGCGGDDDGDSPDTGDLGVPDVPSCDTATDEGANMERSFHIDGLLIPGESRNVGFDVDGLNTTNAQNVAGCNVADRPGGIDNALATIIENLEPLLQQASVDINEKLQEAVTDGGINLTVQLNSWNGTDTDDCVGIQISGTSGGSAITTLTGSAAMSANVISLIAFSSNLRIVPTFQLPPDGGFMSCTVGCVPADLPIVIKGVRARIQFNAGQTAIVAADELDVANTNSTVIGGFVRYTASSPSDADSFENSLNGLIDKIDPNLKETVAPIFTGYLDLDSTPGPGLSRCTATGSMTTSADTFSAGIVARGAVVTP